MVGVPWRISGFIVLWYASLSSCFLDNANATSISGTWTSKSEQVFTGPGFFDPVSDRLIEPRLPGISFSFTDDGHYEEALFFVNSNPSLPSCAKAYLQWQHGIYSFAANGSIVLSPIAVDGRQLLSSACSKQSPTYTRYNQSEVYSRWEAVMDNYHGRYRLNLYKFDGTPVNPMYLAYRPPMMLPTQVLNPIEIIMSKRKRKRDIYLEKSVDLLGEGHAVWWVGVILTLGGSIAFFFV